MAERTRAPRVPKGGKRYIGVGQLSDECGLLAEHLHREQAVSDAELAAWKPGGADNKSKDADGWLKYYRLLQRRQGVWNSRNSGVAGNRDLNDAVMLDVARRAPERLTCVARVSADPQSQPIVLSVFPKSAHALIEIAKIDHSIAWLTAQANVLKVSSQAEDVALLSRAWTEIERLYRRLVWIVTYHDVGLPYADDDTDSEPPEVLKRLTPEDLFRVNALHHKVDQFRLVYLTALLSEKTGNSEGERPSWTTFIGAVAEAQGWTPGYAMRDQTLAELLLMARASADVKAQQAASVKREQEKRREERR